MKRIIKLILFYFLYQLGSLFVLVFLYYLFYGLRTLAAGQGFSFPSSEGLQLLPLSYTIAASLLGSIAFGGHLLAKRYVPFGRSTFSPVSLGMMLIIVPLTFGMSAWMNYLTEALHLPNNFEELFIQMANNAWGVLNIALIAPMFEELLFRGAIEGHLLRQWKNPWGGILLSALIFGAVHGNPAQIPFAFVLGVLLGWLYYRTGSLLPGMLLHFLNNTAAVVLMHAVPADADSMESMFGGASKIGRASCRERV